VGTKLRILAAISAGAAVVPIGPLAHAAPLAAGTACVVTDPRLDEASGLVSTPTGYVAINDGKPGTSVLRLYVLDRGCRITRVITDQGFDPLDPEDLARTADGTLWVADTGDNDRERQTIAIDRIPPGTSRGTTYRLNYPDGAHDAEALLVQPDGTAIVVTKQLSGVAGVYASTRPLTGPGATVPLRAAGSVSLSPTDTQGGPDSGGFGTILVTGAAVSADGRRLALRTYTDAYEWSVSGTDYAAALTGSDPRRTPLPGEPQGEAISFASDGASFVTMSEGTRQPIRRWARVEESKAPPSAAASGTKVRVTAGRAGTDDGRDAGTSVLVAAAVGALGLALLLAGLVGVRRSRGRDRQR
jgi:hypothetical protein